MPRCLPVLKMLATGVNRDATGGLTVAKCLKPVCPGGVPSSPNGVPFTTRCRPGSPRCRPVYPRFAPNHPGLSRSSHGAITVCHGVAPLTSLTVRSGFIKHFNTTVKDPRFALVYTGSSRFATVALRFPVRQGSSRFTPVYQTRGEPES